MMDEDDINGLIQGCRTLKYKFHGVFAANNFPEEMNRNSFLIVNAATAEKIGSHWLLLCRKKQSTFVCRSPWSAHFIVQTPISKNRFRWQQSQHLSTLGESTNSKSKL